jgi:hypothetical protein
MVGWLGIFDAMERRASWPPGTPKLDSLRKEFLACESRFLESSGHNLRFKIIEHGTTRKLGRWGICTL